MAAFIEISIKIDRMFILYKKAHYVDYMTKMQATPCLRSNVD